MGKKIYYVYELIDPMTQTPFYVGKGCGARIDEYFKSDPKISTATKVVIESIRLKGKEVVVKVVRDDIDEDTALTLEASLIKKYGRRTRDVDGILTNVNSHGIKQEKDTQSKLYATIQINKNVKDQIVDHCNRKGLKISRLIEKIFLDSVSGSLRP